MSVPLHIRSIHPCTNLEETRPVVADVHAPLAPNLAQTRTFLYVYATVTVEKRFEVLATFETRHNCV